MARVKRGVTAGRRHKKILGKAKGYYNARRKVFRAAKQAVNSGLEVDLATGLEIERLHFAALFSTEDQKTGMTSFMENGPGKAAFEGR